MSKVLEEKLEKMSKGEQELWALRHTAEHILHTALQNLYPSMKKAMGPATADGFYHDFDLDQKVSEEDFPKIEKEMQRIIDVNIPMIQKFVSVSEAKEIFKHNPYKLEWVDDIEKRGEKVSLFSIGDIDCDLCSGPHAKSTGEVKACKLLSVAGAYWHGDEKNKMLTRVYGTAFSSKKELDHYLWQIDEAKKRDHRKIGKEQELFLISPSVGLGFPLYMPKGLLLRRALENWIIEEKEKHGYKFVWTPHVGKSDLYKQSGHWQKYEAMFNPMKLDEDEYVVKPMNCPHHFQIYNERPHSYRELPLRLAENATVYRNEKQGELNGLLRVRSLTQDDTHTFVQHEQIADEIDRILELAVHIFRTFGFTEYRARVSTRDPKTPEKYLGNAQSWDIAEQALKKAVAKRDIPHFVGLGEAAFYGPKIDIMVKDALGREWQLTTVQLDFNQPENFNMTYIDQKGKEVRPAVLHIAILGSFDRFLAILIEHYAGAFPLWLSPIQVSVIPIGERHVEEAKNIVEKLKDAGLRVELNDKNDPVGAKIRNATLQKIPFMAIIGDREIADKTVSVRTRSGEDLKAIKLSDFINRLSKDIEHKL